MPKVNPLGIPSVREMSLNDELSSEHPEGAIAIISDQLQSASVEEKMCGLQSMAFLSQNQQKAAAIIDSDIVKIAAPLLMDPNKNIRNAVAGALRSLSLCGVEVCENLVEQDVLTPLLELMNEYASAEWTPTIDHSVTHVEQLDQMSDTFLQAVNLVWNLCESTSIALEHFNQTNILESFIRYLDYKVFGIDIGEFEDCLSAAANLFAVPFCFSCCGRAVSSRHFRRQSSRLANLESLLAGACSLAECR